MTIQSHNILINIFPKKKKGNKGSPGPGRKQSLDHFISPNTERQRQARFQINIVVQIR